MRIQRLNDALPALHQIGLTVLTGAEAQLPLHCPAHRGDQIGRPISARGR